MNALTDRLSRALQDIAGKVERLVSPRPGKPTPFILVTFTDGNADYVSNVPRAVGMQALREMLARWDAGMPDTPANKRN